jgi:uncharacterized protein
MGEPKDNEVDRRTFLGLLGAGAAASALPLAGCGHRKAPVAAPAGPMTYRQDPRTGNKVSLLGYGGMRLPRPTHAGRPSMDGEVDDAGVVRSVDYALDHGVNYFDTAPVYCKGQSEAAMGRALSRHPRDRYLVATKMSNFMPKPSREASLALYERSRQNLRVDYLDYYLLHAVGDHASFQERFLDNGVLDFLLKEREAGRIRCLGWSFHGDRAFFDEMLASGITWDFVQIQANYLDWQNLHGQNAVLAKDLYDSLERAKIPAIIMEPVLGGRLARLPHKALVELKQADPVASTASWAFRFVGSLPNVLTVLSGMTYLEHLQDNLLTYSPLKPLTEPDRAMLARAAKALLETPTVGCTGCNYCMPCPYGIDIPGVLGHYDRCLSDGDTPLKAGDPDYHRARQAFLLGLDRGVPRLRQAEHCTGCGTCNRRCPQHIDIASEMRKIDAFTDHLKATV